MSRLSGMKTSRLIRALIAMAMVASACSARADAVRPMRMKILSGSARLTRGEKTRVVIGEASVLTGDRVILSSPGTAELRLAGARLFELEKAALVVDGTTSLTLNRGNLLAVLDERTTIEGAGMDVSSSEGTFRIDRSVASRIGVYDGSAVLRLGPSSVNVPRLRQATAAGGVVSLAAKPLRIKPTDPWDRRYLQEALDLDARLTNFGRGLEAQLGAGVGVSFFGKVLPGGLDLSFIIPYLANRRSDVLIALALASGAADAGRGSMPEYFGRMFALWGDGGSWGLIAYEYGVHETPIFTKLLEAVRRAGLRIGGPAVRPSPTPTKTGTSKPPTSSPPPPPTTPPPPTDPIEQLIDDVVRQLPPVPIPTP